MNEWPFCIKFKSVITLSLNIPCEFQRVSFSYNNAWTPQSNSISASVSFTFLPDLSGSVFYTASPTSHLYSGSVRNRSDLR